MDGINYRCYESLSGFEERLRELRRDGKRIITTNGCFDLIHRGHVTYLNQASVLGDSLVVGINSDASVKRLKGEKRPVQNQIDRTMIVANLKSVDSAFIFYEDDPREFLEKIRPDVHVKGGDYSRDIIERPVVEKYGGRIEILSLVHGYSSSNIISSI